LKNVKKTENIYAFSFEIVKEKEIDVEGEFWLNYCNHIRDVLPMVPEAEIQLILAKSLLFSNHVMKHNNHRTFRRVGLYYYPFNSFHEVLEKWWGDHLKAVVLDVNIVQKFAVKAAKRKDEALVYKCNKCGNLVFRDQDSILGWITHATYNCRILKNKNVPKDELINYFDEVIEPTIPMRSVSNDSIESIDTGTSEKTCDIGNVLPKIIFGGANYLANLTSMSSSSSSSTSSPKRSNQNDVSSPTKRLKENSIF